MSATSQEHGARIEQLLDDVKSSAGPSAWPRVEALVTALVDLYGTGLQRMLAHAREAALDPQDLDLRLGADELVASLLALHDLHPMSVEQRIDQALSLVHPQLPAGEKLALVGIDDGVVTLRATEPTTGGAAASLHLVARAIEHAAPEVAGVRIEGQPTSPSGSRELIPAESLLRGGRA